MVARRTVSRQRAPAAAAAAETTYPDGSNPSTPGQPGIGQPLVYTSDLEPWRSPQYVGGNPLRSPGIVRGPTSPLLIPGAGSALNPPPVLPSAAAAFIDPHHYANLVSATLAVSQAAVQVPFLTQPASLRNFLMLRNPSATANIYIDFQTPASANSPLKIAPGQTFLFDEVVPQNDLYAFADAAGVILTYAFGNIAGVSA